MNNIPVSWVGKLLQQLTHSAFLHFCGFFDIRAGIAFAEFLPVEANRDADLQDAVINAAVIQIGSLLQNGKRNIRGDDMGLPVSSRLSTTSNTRSLPKLVLRSAPKSSRMRRSGRISDFM